MCGGREGGGIIMRLISYASISCYRKKIRRLGKMNESVLIPRLNKTILSMVDVDQVVHILVTILKESALPPRYSGREMFLEPWTNMYWILGTNWLNL